MWFSVTGTTKPIRVSVCHYSVPISISKGHKARLVKEMTKAPCFDWIQLHLGVTNSDHLNSHRGRGGRRLGQSSEHLFLTSTPNPPRPFVCLVFCSGCKFRVFQNVSCDFIHILRLYDWATDAWAEKQRSGPQAMHSISLPSHLSSNVDSAPLE